MDVQLQVVLACVYTGRSYAAHHYLLVAAGQHAEGFAIACSTCWAGPVSMCTVQAREGSLKGQGHHACLLGGGVEWQKCL